ncbi:hypothetical protein C2S52_008348 [Perilla frutescens var. hirtella]|nr:hypothetical protein C2S51_017923 [Perilla frutescens var. frutescens]KAH6783389.1 hypothetical protein C2S52_008348 [Perilla frutescens var. hirtella]
MDRRHVIGKGPMSSSPARGASGQGRLDYFLYHDQGPSSYDVNSYYGQDEGARYLNHDLDGPSRFENLENCRVELLRKLDELKDHISRSCEVTERPPGQRMGTDMMISPAPYPRSHAAYVQEGLTTSHGVNKQPLAPDDIVYRRYVSHAPGFVPFTHTYSSSSRDSHPHGGYPHEFPSYADTYQQEMSRGPYGQPPSQYLHHPYHERRHGYHGNVNHNHLVLNPDENFFHKTTCPCVQCYDKNWDLPAKADPSGPYNQRSPHVLTNPNYHHPPYPIENGQQGYRSGGFNSHTSHSRPSITPNSTELDFNDDKIHQYGPRETEEAHRNGHMLHPVAGGAPFIACSSCFELLRLPRKHISLAKSQQKLKCGACSTIILFELGNKALTVPVSGTFDHVVTEMDDCSSVVMDENVRYQQGSSKLADTDACSDSNDDSLPKVSPADKKSSSGEFEKPLDPLSSASSPSKDQKMPNTLTSSSSAEVKSFPHPILSTEECSDHCSANIVVAQSENGNKGTKSEFDHNVSWQNSVRDSAVSTEIDMSSKEFPKSFISQDSVDKSGERHLRDDKGAESSSAGLVKNSSGDYIKYDENVGVGTSQVFVNGYLIPEHLVQNAELLAGPIQPGEYWYDTHAGFWGVMGYPCLGIIMPNIVEFNYPMPEDCASGNTGVFVNRRELHQKDLDLLASRGLPKTRHRSYLVKISGEVIDEDTGEELDSIGKLAPTVEREKHGFGMKVPTFIARLQESLGPTFGNEKSDEHKDIGFHTGKGSRSLDNGLHIEDRNPDGDLDAKSQIDIVLHSLSPKFEQFKLNFNMIKKDITLSEFLMDLQAAELVQKRNL